MDEEMCEEAYEAFTKVADPMPVDVVAIAGASITLEALEVMMTMDVESGDTGGIEIANQIQNELIHLMASFGYQANITTVQ